MTELSAEDKQFIKELREKHEDGKINRRQALGMLGAAGVGAAGGFFGSGTAAADASTTDDDGNVGLPSDRVDVFAEGVSVDKLNSKSAPSSYQIRTDGTNITATPQDNPSGADMNEVTGTDIGTVLTDIIVNQLPPQGDAIEAAGKILLKRGEYPGTLNEVPLGSQLTLEGETVSHWISGGATGRDQQIAPVTLRGEPGSASFINPTGTDGRTTYVKLKNLELIGPGHDNTGSVAIETDTNRTPKFDWLWLDRIVIQRYETVARLLNIDNQVLIKDCHFLEFGNSGSGYGIQITGGDCQVTDTSFWSETEPSYHLRLTDHGAKVRGCKFVTPASASGHPTKAYVDIGGDGVTVIDNHFRANPSGGGGGSIVNADGQFGAALNRVTVNNDNSTTFFNVQPGASGVNVVFNYVEGQISQLANDQSDGSNNSYYFNASDGNISARSVRISGANGASDVDVYNPGIDANPEVVNSPTRPRWKGIIGGGPLGGVDLGSVSGQFDGDQAITTGATASVGSVLAHWDGPNLQWIYPDSVSSA